MRTREGECPHEPRNGKAAQPRQTTNPRDTTTAPQVSRRLGTAALPNRLPADGNKCLPPWSVKESNAQTLLHVYWARSRVERPLAFDLAWTDAVRVVFLFAQLYGDRELLPRWWRSSPQLEAYLDTHSPEEIAGHIQLYKLEYDCESDEPEPGAG